jgi:DHA2 family multidrug resistance protein
LRGADYLGIVLLALCLGCLEYTMEEGPRWNWFSDGTITATAWVSGLSGLLFVWRTLTFARPIVDLRALKELNFALGCFFSFIAGVGLFATIYLTPLFLAQVRGFSALQIGEAIFSTGIFQIVSIPVYSFLANRIDLRWLLMFGLSCFAFSMWSFTPMTHDWGARELLLPQAFRGMAQQFAIAPVVTLTLGSLAPERLKMASGLFNLMRNLGGAIGIAWCATLLNDRTNMHFFRLAEYLTAPNEAMNAMLATLQTHFIQLGYDSPSAATAALHQLWAMTYREALTLTFSDTFMAIMACFLVAAAMVPLMRKVGRPAGPSSAH